jgi:hypothetical protein
MHVGQGLASVHEQLRDERDGDEADRSPGEAGGTEGGRRHVGAGGLDDADGGHDDRDHLIRGSRAGTVVGLARSAGYTVAMITGQSWWSTPSRGHAAWCAGKDGASAGAPEFAG